MTSTTLHAGKYGSCPLFVQLNHQEVEIKRAAGAAKLLIYMTSQVGLLTIYDMCKAVDRGMAMNGITLREKHGGKSGSFVNAL